MHVTVILAHPGRHSFNHAIALAAVAELNRLGHRATLRDLYAEKFDPLLPAPEVSISASPPPQVAAHCQEIASADGIIVVHPNWWGQPPAILKGWVDRVLRPGVAYRFREGDKGDGVPTGLLKAQAAIVFNTSNTSAEREAQGFGDPLETIWKNCIFGLCGVPVFYREMFRVVVASTPDQRREWLNKVRRVVAHYFPADAPGDAAAARVSG